MNGCLHKASELAPDERLVVERWLGRPVGQDETITLTAYPEPSESEREAAWRQVMAAADTIGSRVHADEAEVDDLVDEAIRDIRGRRT